MDSKNADKKPQCETLWLFVRMVIFMQVML